MSPHVNAFAGVSRRYVTRLCSVLARVDMGELDRAIDLIGEKWRSGHQIVACGNGGSAMVALQYITDWNQALTRPAPFRGRTLVDNMGLILAYANDASYADIFAEQVESAIEPGDLLIGISTSGNSENVVRAIVAANGFGCSTLGICGFSGGRLRECAQRSIWVQSADVQLCEDAHALFGHVVTRELSKLCAKELGARDGRPA